MTKLIRIELKTLDKLAKKKKPGETNAQALERLLNEILDVPDEDLKQRNQIAKEIIGIKGRQLFIEKQNGDAWQYTVRNEVTDDILAKLEERQTEGWKPLGMAIFETSPNSPLLKLVQIGL